MNAYIRPEHLETPASLQASSELRQLLEITRDKQAPLQTEFVSIDDFTYGDPIIWNWGEGAYLRIGKFCSIAVNVQLVMGGNHRSDWGTTYPFNDLLPAFSHIKGHPATKGNILIGNDVWLASDSKIMSGVTIGNGAIVAANALVVSGTNIEPYSIYGGVPAKRIGYRFSQDLIDRFQEMAWWDWSLDKLVDAIPLLQSDRFDELYTYYLKNVKA